MSWQEDWWLCSGRGCRYETKVPVQEQALMLSQMQSAKPDWIRLQNVRSFLSREKAGADLSRLADKQVMEEVNRLCKAGRLHLHARPRKYHVAGAYSEAATSGASVAERSGTSTSAASKRSTGAVDWDTWIEIKLTNELQKPMSGVRFQIRLPDKSIKEGRLDDKGEAHVDSVKGGLCEITFPDLDGREWQPL